MFSGYTELTIGPASLKPDQRTVIRHYNLLDDTRRHGLFRPCECHQSGIHGNLGFGSDGSVLTITNRQMTPRDPDPSTTIAISVTPETGSFAATLSSGSLTGGSAGRLMTILQRTLTSTRSRNTGGLIPTPESTVPRAIGRRRFSRAERLWAWMGSRLQYGVQECRSRMRHRARPTSDRRNSGDCQYARGSNEFLSGRASRSGRRFTWIWRRCKPMPG